MKHLLRNSVAFAPADEGASGGGDSADEAAKGADTILSGVPAATEGESGSADADKANAAASDWKEDEWGNKGLPEGLWPRR